MRDGGGGDRMMARNRQGRISYGTLLLLLVVGVGVGWGMLFGPKYIDYLNINECSGMALAAWHAHGVQERAPTRFNECLADKGIEDMTIESCKIEPHDNNKYMYCYWEVYVYYPGTDYYKTLSFEVTNELDLKGAPVKQ
jgi:hypothetical protein